MAGRVIMREYGCHAGAVCEPASLCRHQRDSDRGTLTMSWLEASMQHQTALVDGREQLETI